jgi:hypothetical protein
LSNKIIGWKTKTRSSEMGENLHVTDGKMTGGKVGSIVCGIIVALFFNIIVAPGTQGDSPAAFRVIFAILSIGNIPIAIIGQKISQKIFDLMHGKDSASIYVSTSLKDVVIHKFSGAIIVTVVFDSIILLVLGKLMGLF